MPTLEITVPMDLGGPEECVVVTWLKRVGDPVRREEPLVILQAEKVSFELPAPADGVLTEILANQGDVVTVGQIIARVAAESASEGKAAPTATVTSPAETALPPERTPEGPVRASPIAKRLAREHGIDLSQIQGTGAGGRITEKDVRAAIEAQQPREAAPEPPQTAPERPLRASPVAKRLAREYGIDLSQVQGTGAGGRITEKDVRAFIERGQITGEREVVRPETAPPSAELIPLAGMRAAIARRMMESLQNMAQLTLFTEIDVTELQALYQTIKAQTPVTYTDLLVRAVALALRAHPRINVTLEGDHIRVLPYIHIGVAVAVSDGLVVPVIRDADRKTIAELAAVRADLVERARAGRLTAEEMQGGTFTVTNLGMYDIDGFTPIINPPEAAILGVGRMVEKVVIHQGKIAQRTMMVLSLTIDHRLIDGAPGAAFLQTLKRLLEEPHQLT